jgi:hypothetical protein
MKSLFPRILIFLLNFLFLNSYANGQTPVDWSVEQLRSLSPREFEILKRFNELPDHLTVNIENGTMSTTKTGSMLEYMKGGDRFDCLSDIGTNVHELNHIITADYSYEYCRIHNRIFNEKNMYYFYLDTGNEMVVFSNVDYFPSSVLIPQINEANRTFRFNTYIGGNSSTQSDGFLGLLDEYNAYHHSLNTVWDLKSAYLKATDDPVKGYIQWMSTLISDVEAYYEFRFFILEYLRYARLNKPEVYGQIKSEPDLITVFNRITECFRTIVTKYDQELTANCKNYWEKLGWEVYPSDDGKFCLIGKNGAARGFSLILEDRDKLLPLLQSHRYDEVIQELNIIP